MDSVSQINESCYIMNALVVAYLSNWGKQIKVSANHYQL